MLKMQVSYENFDGVIINEDLYFNLNKREMIEMSDKLKGLSNVIDKITGGKDVSKMSTNELGRLLVAQGAESLQKVAETIDVMIDMSYGKRSEDGKRFIKNQEVLSEFKETLAYSAFVDKLLSDDNYARVFTQGILPNDAPLAAQA